MTKEENQFLEQMYQKQYRQLVAYAYKFVQDYELANEIVQEAFAVACQKVDVVMKHDKPIFWMMRTIKYSAYNDRRKRSRYSKVFQSLDAMALEQLPATEDELGIETMFGNRLSPDEYHMLKRIVIEKATYQEVAKEQNITIWAAQKRMQRLLKKIEREQLI